MYKPEDANPYQLIRDWFQCNWHRYVNHGQFLQCNMDYNDLSETKQLTSSDTQRHQSSEQAQIGICCHTNVIQMHSKLSFVSNCSTYVTWLSSFINSKTVRILCH